MAPGPADGEVALTWFGCPTTFTIYRSDDPSSVVDPGNVLTSTSADTLVDLPPAGAVHYYLVLP